MDRRPASASRILAWLEGDAQEASHEKTPRPWAARHPGGGRLSCVGGVLGSPHSGAGRPRQGLEVERLVANAGKPRHFAMATYQGSVKKVRLSLRSMPGGRKRAVGGSSTACSRSSGMGYGRDIGGKNLGPALRGGPAQEECWLPSTGLRWRGNEGSPARAGSPPQATGCCRHRRQRRHQPSEAFQRQVASPAGSSSRVGQDGGRLAQPKDPVRGLPGMELLATRGIGHRGLSLQARTQPGSQVLCSDSHFSERHGAARLFHGSRSGTFRIVIDVRFQHAYCC